MLALKTFGDSVIIGIKNGGTKLIA